MAKQSIPDKAVRVLGAQVLHENQAQTPVGSTARAPGRCSTRDSQRSPTPASAPLLPTRLLEADGVLTSSQPSYHPPLKLGACPVIRGPASGLPAAGHPRPVHFAQVVSHLCAQAAAPRAVCSLVFLPPS